MNKKSDLLENIVAHFAATLTDGTAKKLIATLEKVPPTPDEALKMLKLFVEKATVEECRTYPLFVAKGAVLQKINAHKLYLTDKDKMGESRHKDFGSYCTLELKMDRSRVYKNIKGARQYAHLVEKAAAPLPTNFHQLEPIISLTPEDALRAWQKTQKVAGDGPIIGSMVKRAVIDLGLRPENSAQRPAAPALTKAQFKSLGARFQLFINLPPTETARRNEMIVELCEFLGVTPPTPPTVAESATVTAVGAAKPGPPPSAEAAVPEAGQPVPVLDTNWQQLKAAKIQRPDEQTLLISFEGKDARQAKIKSTATTCAVVGGYNFDAKTWVYHGTTQAIDAFQSEMRMMLSDGAPPV
jgi:hypothetical protein